MFGKPDHPNNDNGLLFGFYAGESAAESPKFNLNANGYEGGHPGFNTLVARYTFDSSKKQLIRSTVANDAVLLRQELITSVLEFTPGKILMSTYHNQLLLFERWQCVKIYNDSNPENLYQMFSTISTLQTLPGFHEVHFPFVVW